VSARATFLAAALVALVAVVAAVFVLRAWYERQPPPLDESGPGTALRLTAETGGVPPPRYDVRLPDGSSATLAMAGIGTRGGRAVGQVTVLPAAGEARELTLGEGESARAGGVTVTLTHIWRMPDHANDAIDVRVVPTT
jgi:hypothetical protein